MISLLVLKKKSVCEYLELLKSSITLGFDVNVIIGIRANGSCNICTQFNKSFIPVKSRTPFKDIATVNVGTIAIARVTRTRFQRAQRICKNP